MTPPTPRWRRLETLGMDAFPAMVEEHRNGCVFRAAGGFNFRNSSVTLLDPAAISPDRLIAETRTFCAAHAIAPVLRMPLLWPEVEAALAAAGWERFRDCHVLDRPLDDLGPADLPHGPRPAAAVPAAAPPPGAMSPGAVPPTEALPTETALKGSRPSGSPPTAAAPTSAPPGPHTPTAPSSAPIPPAAPDPAEASLLPPLHPISHPDWLAHQLGGRGASAEDAERMRAVYARLPASAERLGWWPGGATAPGAPPPAPPTPAAPMPAQHRADAAPAAEAPAQSAAAGSRPAIATALLFHDGPDVALMNMLVAPEARGSGTGRRMLRALMSHAARQGRRRMWLQVLSTNAPALALYRSEGFGPVYDYAYWRPSAGPSPDPARDPAPDPAPDRKPRP